MEEKKLTGSMKDVLERVRVDAEKPIRKHLQKFRQEN